MVPSADLQSSPYRSCVEWLLAPASSASAADWSFGGGGAGGREVKVQAKRELKVLPLGEVKHAMTQLDPHSCIRLQSKRKGGLRGT